MKSILFSVAFLPVLLCAQTPPAPHKHDPKVSPLLSEKLEIEQTYAKGKKFLLSTQKPEGYWGEESLPAFTALALRALLHDPTRDHKKPLPANYQKALDWLVTKQKTDGGIYGKGLATYNTSAAIMALMAANPDKYKPMILKARAFLINQQTDWGVRGESDSEFDGGIGYGGTYAHSDLSNTHLAIEALYHSKSLVADTGEAAEKQPDLDWEAALAFISRCQNLQESNPGDIVGNDGSFVYFPGNSKAGTEESKSGRVSLRGYGSMSYAGLLSFVYADLSKDDPRVKAVLDWLSKNYTLEENPGLEGQGLYYYYLTMTKALTAANVTTLPQEDTDPVDWRRQLATRLLSTQREDGSWINQTSRWMENDPTLVTSYTLTTLAQIHATIE